MNWEPTYALLILTSSITTFLCAKYLEIFDKQKLKKKIILIFSLVINLGILFIFKYYNFINESVFWSLKSLGIRWEVPGLHILLPVGISFYTFQAIGYTIDVYNNKIRAEKHFGIYALFVSFFPQLVAGPIERAKNLLPQFKQNHFMELSNISAGLKQMLWGYFMKIVIADRVALYVDAVYNNPENHNGSSFMLATFLFSVQIYCDFAGYSAIAIGAARVMGFNLMENFHRPYFAISIGQFWKRWHISLSTWFKDYVYIQLGGNRVNKYRHLLNLLITFTVSGLWHGANWTFLYWGLLHGIFLVIEVLFTGKFLWLKKFKILNLLFIFLLTTFAWIFFRANSINDAHYIIGQIFTNIQQPFIDKTVLGYSFLAILVLFIKEVFEEFAPTGLSLFNNKRSIVRFSSYTLVFIAIILLGVFDGGQFIYFQF